MNLYPPRCAPGKHQWGYVSFSYASWTECSLCGLRPVTEDEFNQENKEVAS